MLIDGNNNLSQLSLCIASAHHYLLSEQEAKAIIDKFVSVIEQNWAQVCETSLFK